MRATRIRPIWWPSDNVETVKTPTMKDTGKIRTFLRRLSDDQLLTEVHSTIWTDFANALLTCQHYNIDCFPNLEVCLTAVLNLNPASFSSAPPCTPLPQPTLEQTGER